MLLEALYHVPRDKWAYAYDSETIHLRVRTSKDDVDKVVAITGDKYDWDATNYEITLQKEATDSMFDYWEAWVKPKYKRLSYCFRVDDNENSVFMIDKGITHEYPHPVSGYYEFPFIHEVDLFRIPQWAKDAVFYQIFPERFANGDPGNDPETTEPWGGEPTRNNFFGGDLQGVIDHLDYLQHLGVNAIYFTPVFASPSNHKYDIVDYLKVDPQFGDNELLKRLIAECHGRGMKVMLDAVFNHCSNEFPPFRDVAENGEQSRYKDWFHVDSFPLEVRDGIPTYATFGFHGNMPKFNTANPEVKAYLLGVAEYWIKEIGADGWRLDVANEVDHRFWREFRQLVKAANPEAFIVGEVWSDSLTWLQGDQFDSVMNYPFSDAVLDYFSGGVDSETFAQRIGSLLVRYPKQTNEVVFNLLGSHDTVRLLNALGEDKRKMKLAVLFLFTFLGTPCIYYGDEIGMSGGDDPDCRKCMVWEPEDQDRELFEFYRRLIALRLNNKALRAGSFRTLLTCGDDPCIVYERADEEQQLTVWINNTDAARTLSCSMETTGWQDALTGDEVTAEEGTISIPLQPFGFRILSRSLT